MIMHIIAQVLNETERKLRNKIRDCQEVINHFTDPIPDYKDYSDYLEYAKVKAQYFKDHMDGKYSVSAMEKAYDDMAGYETQLRDLASMRYICANYIDKK